MNLTRRQFIHDTSQAMIAGSLIGAGGALANTPVPTSRRALSLRVLQEKLERGHAMAGERSVIRDLAGITRLQGYAIDNNRNDIVLFGAVDPDWPALKLVDLTVALRNGFHRYTETIGDTVYYSYPGCSIDPDAASIARLDNVSERVGALVASGDGEAAKAVWTEACRSPQSVRIFGVPDSRFADICVVADYRMKAICDGSLELDVDGFDSLAAVRAARVFAEMREGQDSTASVSNMNRFWFTPGQQQFQVDDGISLIAETSVALKTEQEVMTSQGTIAGTGNVDAEAEQWARDFTRYYHDIAVAEGSGIYLQLQQLFEHVAIAKLLARDSSATRLPDLNTLLDGLRIPQAGVPSELEGRGNLISLRHVTETERQILTRTASLQLCGGVGIEIDLTDETITRNSPGARLLRSQVVDARPADDRLWWTLPAHTGIAA